MLKYLWHLGELVKDGKDIQAIIKHIASGGEKFPSKDEVTLLLDDVKKLVDEEIIVIPGLNKDDVERIISEIESAVA